MVLEQAAVVRLSKDQYCEFASIPLHHHLIPRLCDYQRSAEKMRACGDLVHAPGPGDGSGIEF